MNSIPRWDSSRSFATIATQLVLLFGSGCAESSHGPIAALEPSEVHQALLRQFEYAGPSVFLVDPLTPQLRETVAPMDESRLAYHRRDGVDIDSDLASAFAQALAGPQLSVDVPSTVSRLRLWDGERLGTMPEKPVFYSFEGRQAAIVQLFPVAFSEDGRKAVTYLDIYCGPDLCALGLIVLLRRVGVDWVLESQSMTWQS